MMLIQKLISGLTLLCSLAVPTTAQELPKWLVEAKAREAKLGDLREVSSKDGWMRTKVPGILISPIEFKDASYSVNIRLGDEVIVACTVRKGDLDLANSMSRLTQVTFESLQKRNGDINFRAVESTDAGAIGNARFLEQHWIYRADRGREKNAGAVKILLATRDDASIFCFNENHGNIKAFRTTVESLISNLRTNSEQSISVQYLDFRAISINNARTGTIETSLSKEVGGAFKLIERDSLLVQSAPGNLNASDTYRIEWTKGDGTLLGAQRILIVNGSVIENVKLDLIDDRWTMAGVVKEKQIQAVLPSAPSTFIQVARKFHQHLSQAKPEGGGIDTLAWISSDLTRLTPMKTTIQYSISDVAFASTQEIGGLTLETVLDKNNGTVIRSKRTFGSYVRVDERLYQQGGF